MTKPIRISELQDIRALPSPNAIAERLTSIVRAMTTNPQATVAQTAPVLERIDVHVLCKGLRGAKGRFIWVVLQTTPRKWNFWGYTSYKAFMLCTLPLSSVTRFN